MVVKALVGGGDQGAVKPRFAFARLIAGDQNHRLPCHVEGERHPPHTIRCVETKLLHVGVLRVLERIHMRPSEQRPMLSSRRAWRQVPFAWREAALKTQRRTPHESPRRSGVRGRMRCRGEPPVFLPARRVCLHDSQGHSTARESRCVDSLLDRPFSRRCPNGRFRPRTILSSPRCGSRAWD
jgi:hypothetical protein